MMRCILPVVVLIYMLGPLVNVSGQSPRDVDYADAVARIRSLERDQVSVREDIAKLNIEQRMTRLETKLEEGQKANESMAGFVKAIFAGLIVLVFKELVAAISGAWRRMQPSNQNAGN